jgi:hypothetical protein
VKRPAKSREDTPQVLLEPLRRYPVGFICPISILEEAYHGNHPVFRLQDVIGDKSVHFF